METTPRIEYLEFVDRLHHDLASARSNTTRAAVIRGSCEKILGYEDNVLIWASALLAVVRASRDWDLSLDTIPQLDDITKLTSHEDENKLSAAVRKRRALAALVAFWSYDRVQYYDFHAYSLRSLEKLVRLASAHPDWHDFVRKINLSLIARHERSIKDAKCSRIGLHNSRSNVHTKETPLESVDIDHAINALHDGCNSDAERRLHMWLHPCQCLLHETGMTEAQARFYMIRYDLHKMLVPEKDRSLSQCPNCSTENISSQSENFMLPSQASCQALVNASLSRPGLPSTSDASTLALFPVQIGEEMELTHNGLHVASGSHDPIVLDFSFLENAGVMAVPDVELGSVGTALCSNTAQNTVEASRDRTDSIFYALNISGDNGMGIGLTEDSIEQSGISMPDSRELVDWSWPSQGQEGSAPLAQSSLSSTADHPCRPMGGFSSLSSETLHTRSNSEISSCGLRSDTGGQLWPSLNTPPSPSLSPLMDVQTLCYFPPLNSITTTPEPFQDGGASITARISVVDLDIALSHSEPYVNMQHPIIICSKCPVQACVNLAAYIANLGSTYQGLSVNIYQDRHHDTWTPVETVIQHLQQELTQTPETLDVWYMESMSRVPPDILRRLPQFRLLETLIQRRKARLMKCGAGMSYLSLSDTQNHLIIDAIRPKGSFQKPRLETLGHRWIKCLFGNCAFRLAMQATVCESDFAAFRTNSDAWDTRGQGETIVLSPGDIVLIPCMTVYTAMANESCVTEEGTFWDDRTIVDILGGLSSDIECQDEGYQQKLRAEVSHIVEEFFTIDQQNVP